MAHGLGIGTLESLCQMHSELTQAWAPVCLRHLKRPTCTSAVCIVLPEVGTKVRQEWRLCVGHKGWWSLLSLHFLQPCWEMPAYCHSLPVLGQSSVRTRPSGSQRWASGPAYPGPSSVDLLLSAFAWPQLSLLIIASSPPTSHPHSLHVWSSCAQFFIGPQTGSWSALWFCP